MSSFQAVESGSEQGMTFSTAILLEPARYRDDLIEMKRSNVDSVVLLRLSGRAAGHATHAAIERQSPQSSCMIPGLEALPVHHRAVVGIIGLRVLGVVADLASQGVFVELDAEPRAGR